jgi:hypothetical protein
MGIFPEQPCNLRIDSVTGMLSVGKVIPDGNGGALATSAISTGANQGSVQISDIGGSGSTATLPLNYARQPDIVLGPSGTVGPGSSAWF